MKRIAPLAEARVMQKRRGRRLEILAAALAVLLATGAARGEPLPRDAAFGDGGSALLEQPGSLRNTAVQASGRIVVVAEHHQQLVLTALHPDGTTDASFGDGGVVTLTDSGPSRALGKHTGLAAQQDGRIVVSGSTIGGEPYVARLLPDGTRDAGFGEGGVAVPALDPALCADARCDAVAAALDASGRIVLAVAVVDGGQDRIAVVRLTAEGATDPSFGDGGTALLGPAAAGKSDVPFGIAIGSDGRIVVAGNRHVRTYFDTEILVFALTPDGALDPAFAGGEAAHVVGGGFINGVGVALRPNGRIVVGGSGERPDGLRDMMALRLLSSGALDRSFGDGGIAFAGAVRNLYPHARSTISAASTVIVASDGKIFLAGVSGTPQGTGPCPPTPYVALAWLTSAGRATPAVTLAAWEGVPRALAFTRSRALVVAGDEPAPCMSPAEQQMRVTLLLPIAPRSASGPTPIRPPGGRALPRR